MQIDLDIPATDLADATTRIDLLAQIAEGAAREVRLDPAKAIMDLMAAAALITLRAGGRAPDLAALVPAAIGAAVAMRQAEAG